MYLFQNLHSCWKEVERELHWKRGFTVSLHARAHTHLMFIFKNLFIQNCFSSSDTVQVSTGTMELVSGRISKRHTNMHTNNSQKSYPEHLPLTTGNRAYKQPSQQLCSYLVCTRSFIAIPPSCPLPLPWYDSWLCLQTKLFQLLNWS